MRHLAQASSGSSKDAAPLGAPQRPPRRTARARLRGGDDGVALGLTLGLDVDGVALGLTLGPALVETLEGATIGDDVGENVLPADVAAGDVIGTQGVAAVEDGSVTIGYIGGLRYIKLVFDPKARQEHQSVLLNITTVEP